MVVVKTFHHVNQVIGAVNVFVRGREKGTGGESFWLFSSVLCTIRH
jgi:hypothetical protein